MEKLVQACITKIPLIKIRKRIKQFSRVSNVKIERDSYYRLNRVTEETISLIARIVVEYNSQFVVRVFFRGYRICDS